VKKSGLLLGCLGIVLVIVVIFAVWGIGTYNRLVQLDENVDEKWSQVENVYQRRADLIPSLVKTVQGAADFERQTLQDVVEARARVGQVNVGNPTGDPEAFRRFEAAQDGLTSALSRLLVVVERYPEIRATQGFLELQSQLEGTENRVAVERRRYNEAARDFNTAARRFPATVIAAMTGFSQKEYFRAREGADRPPEVEFNFR
jgi:LemA protein